MGRAVFQPLIAVMRALKKIKAVLSDPRFLRGRGTGVPVESSARLGRPPSVNVQRIVRRTRPKVITKLSRLVISIRPGIDQKRSVSPDIVSE